MKPEDIKQINESLRPMISDATEREVNDATKDLEKKIDMLSAAVADVTSEIKDLAYAIRGNEKNDSPGLLLRVRNAEDRLNHLERACGEFTERKKDIEEIIDNYNGLKWTIRLAGALGVLNVGIVAAIIKYITDIY